MRAFKNTITLLFLLGSFGYTGYSFYQMSLSPCEEIIKYSIGRFDKQFGVDQKTFLTRVKDAEMVWEQTLGKDLFVYDPEADFKINLIYDERQLATIQKQKTEFGLAEVEGVLKNLDNQFNQMKFAYDARSDAYKSAASAFEARQAGYESKVDYWNAQGGAPKKEYEELRNEARYLSAEVAKLNSETSALNIAAKELNNLLDRRNQAAAEYNKVAKNYNQKYGHGLEFNQAEYTGEEINVYQFSNQKDLEVALAHEFGHALGMDHVENSASIMYYITGGNGEVDLSPSTEDLVELNRVCN